MEYHSKSREELQKELDLLKDQNDILLSIEQFNIEILNAISEAIVIIQKDSGTIIKINNTFLNLFGYIDIQEVIRSNVNNFLSENFSEKTNKLIKESKNTEAPQIVSFIERAKRKDGSLFWANVVLKYIGISSIERILIIIKDITKQKLSEEALNVSENQYKNLFDNMPNGYYKSTPEGYFVDANPAFVKMLGYESKDELLSVFIPDILYVKSSERDEIMNENQNFISALEIYRLKTKDGHIIWVEDNARYIKDEDGKTIFNEGICRDITTRKLAEEKIKKSEERFRKMADLLPQTVFEIDLNGNLVFINSMSLKTFGYSLEDVEKGMNVLSMIRVEDRARVKENMAKVLNQNISRGNEYIAQKKDGTLFPVIISSSLIIENEKPIGIRGILVDITEQKKAEISIRESEYKFKSLFETSSDAIFIMNQFVFLDCNSKTSEIFGCQKEQIIGHSPSEFSPEFQPDERTSAEKAFEKITLALQGEVQFFDWIHKRFNGTEFYAEVSLHKITIKGENLLHAIVRDIFDRKKIEKSLIESEEKFRSIVQAMNDSITIVDSNALITYQSPPAYKSFGYAYGDIVGMNIFDFIHPEDITIAKNEMHSVLKSTNKGMPTLFRIKHKKGRYVFIEAIGINMLENKAINGIVFISKDVTERFESEKLLVQSEERYRITIEQTGQLVYDLDIRTSNILWSGAVEKITGFTNKEFNTVDLKAWADLIHPVDRLLSFDLLNKAISEIGPYNVEYRMKTKNSTYIYIENNGIVLSDETGNANRMLGTMKDITYRKNAEFAIKEKTEEIEIQNAIFQQLNEELIQTNEFLVHSKKKAEESDRLKTAFLANISHEIRTPMNGILGFAELLKMPGLSDQKNDEFIKMIELSGQRMLNIINDIVDIAKIEAGEIQMHFQQTSLNKLMKDLFAFFKPEADNKKLHLIFNTGLGENLSIIMTDQTKLNQILSNLIKNALKFTITGTIEFGYSLSGKMLSFYVKDTGIGIQPVQKEIIFERFVQGNMALNRNYEGAGLGLAISKSYVEKLGGKIWLDSEINKGSTFFFEIPYHSGYLNISKPSQLIKVTSEFSKTTILIVEDDPNSMYYLREILTNENIKLLIAGDGRKAIDLLIANPEIDLILMDLKMPVMDGYEATLQIKQLKPGIKIIAQTAFAATEELKKATEAGCDDYLIKPIRKEKLFELLLKYQPLR